MRAGLAVWVLMALSAAGKSVASKDEDKASGTCSKARRMSHGSEQCDVAKSHDCDNTYAIAYYCSSSTARRGALVVLYALWLALLFSLLGSTADEYFSPALEQMSSEFGLPPRFAGVTLLALGNGAPDVSSTLHAVAGSRNGYRLALGALTGAGMFVGSVVAGAVTVVANGAKAKGALLRDVSAYMCAIGIILSVLGGLGHVTYAGVTLFLTSYVLFVCMVLAADIWHRRPGGPAERQAAIEQAADDDDEPPAIELLMTLLHSVRRHDQPVGDELALAAPKSDGEAEIGFDTSGGYVVIDGGDAAFSSSNPMHDDSGPLELDASSLATGFLQRPDRERDDDDVDNGNVFVELWQRCISHVWNIFFEIPVQHRFLAVGELPFVFARRVTVPLTSEDSYARGPLIMSLLGAPLWLCAYAVMRNASVGPFAIAAACLAGVVASAAVALATRDNEKLTPVPSLVLALFGFVVAATWIDVFADQLVQVLEFFGAAIGIPETVLGLTVLAWGNSVGDLSTNVAMAKRGLGNMSMTACFAGPLFNALVGLGVGFSARLASVKKDTGHSNVKATLNPGLWVGFIALLINCLAVLTVGIFNRGQIPKKFGFVSIFIYVAYLVVSLVVFFSSHSGS